MTVSELIKALSKILQQDAEVVFENTYIFIEGGYKVTDVAVYEEGGNNYVELVSDYEERVEI